MRVAATIFGLVIEVRMCQIFLGVLFVVEVLTLVLRLTAKLALAHGRHIGRRYPGQRLFLTVQGQPLVAVIGECSVVLTLTSVGVGYVPWKAVALEFVAF